MPRTLTPSMRVALKDLDLTRLMVLYPGTHRYALADRVVVVPHSSSPVASPGRSSRDAIGVCA